MILLSRSTQLLSGTGRLAENTWVDKVIVRFSLSALMFCELETKYEIGNSLLFQLLLNQSSSTLTLRCVHRIRPHTRGKMWGYENVEDKGTNTFIKPLNLIWPC